MDVTQLLHQLVLMDAYPLVQNAIMSLFALVFTYYMIPEFEEAFVKANLYGVDMAKRRKTKVPEAMGVVCGAAYLVTMFLFIPFPFYQDLTDGDSNFPHHEFVEFVTALLSICCMIFLGFADDVLDLKWRHRLTLPTVATLPLLMVYLVNFDSTTVVVPKPLRYLFGLNVNLGVLYYVYMGMMAIFCTNAINIYAGINGLEVGQSLIIALSIVIFNLCELFGEHWQQHTFSLYLMLPYCGVCLALFLHNRYPSRVFVGDTFCYFSGMTFAVVAILGHFSKTVLLFFIPQLINFLYSVPQLFRLVPCPRHRLPQYDPDHDHLTMSYSPPFKYKSLPTLGKLAVCVCHRLGVLDVRLCGEDGEYMTCNNMTLINFTIKLCGPLHERTLTNRLLCLQVLSSCLAFFIRYQLAKLFYDV